MPEKEVKKSKEDGTLSRLKDVLIEKFSSIVMDNITEHLQNIIHKLQEVAYYTQRRIIEQFYVSGFFFAGCVFIAVAIMFYLTDALQWPRSNAALAMGAILLIVSGVLKQYVRRTSSTGEVKVWQR